MGDIDLHERILRHPSLLLSLKVMKPFQKRNGIMYECFNINVRKAFGSIFICQLFNLSSKCIVCGRKSSPMSMHDTYHIKFEFTCSRELCRQNSDVADALDEMHYVASMITSPNQDFLF